MPFPNKFYEAPYQEQAERPTYERSELRESPEYDPNFRRHRTPWYVWVIIGLLVYLVWSQPWS